MNFITQISQTLGLSEFVLGLILGFVIAWIFLARRQKSAGIVQVPSYSQSVNETTTSVNLEPTNISVSTSTSNLDTATTERIKQALISGNKIEAIKILREATGADLMGAKSAIEGLEKVFKFLR